MTAVDALTDEELYAHFVEECIVALLHDLAMLDVLADAWKRSGLNIDFHSFVGWYCSDITGIPDFEHFINNEILNPRIAHAQVELIPQRWLDGVAPISTGHPPTQRGGAGTMSGTDAKKGSTVEIVNITPRRRWSVSEKIRMIEASMTEGQSISLVARAYGVAPNLLYRWRKQMSEGGKTAIEANDEVVSVAEVKALKKRIRQLERVLGNKTLEVEILKEAVRIGREKKLISRLPLSGVEDFQ